MKKLFFLGIIFFFSALFSVSYSQENIKTLTETSVQDFSDNQLTNLIITNDSGGEVQLRYPLVKTVDDYNDNSINRFIAKDSIGNFVKTWVQGGNAFVKKYTANGTGITGTIKVNDDTISAGDNYPSKVATLNDGIYIVIWNNDYVWYGQVFKDDSVKSGKNFRINESNNEHSAAVIANNRDNNFLLFYTQKTEGIYRLYIQKRDTGGNKLEESRPLNPDDTMYTQISPSAIGDKNGFWVAWDGANGSSSWDLDVYLRRFNYDGSPDGSVILVNDNLEKMQGTSDLSIDNNSNLFVVWLDERDAVEPFIGLQYDVYGQIFDANGNRIGNNIRINSFGQRNENLEPDVYFNNNEFQISWLYWNLTYVNKWKLEPALLGEMISSIFDGSPYGCIFEKIYWEEILNPETDLKFQIRTGKTINEINNSNWHGPNGNTDYYTNSSGEKINTIHDGDRYIQYKAVFNSSTGSSSILKSISIDYTSSDTLPPLPPINLTATPSHAKNILKWQLGSNENLLEYKIYRGRESNKYDSTWQIIIPQNNTNYEDTSAEVGKKYFYVLTAFDSSHNESGFSNEATATSYGINVYVSAASGPGGDGSINNPFNTIQQGINYAIAGDSVRVLLGTYNNPFTLKYGVSLIGTSAEECEINSTVTASDNCVIKGLTLTKSLACNSDSPIITENIFRATDPSNFTAITISGLSSPVISKNFISECSVAIRTQSMGNTLIENNIINANDIGVDFLDFTATVINNIIIANSYGAIRALPVDSIKIENNILIGGINIPSHYDVSGINYNDVIDFEGKVSSPQLPPTNIFVDPGFVNESLQDYHLSLSSPCIDAGNPDPVYNDVDGTRNDMGAYGGPDPIQSYLSSQLTRSIYVSNVPGDPGDTVSVFISLDNTAGFAKGDFTLEVDNSLLKYISVKPAGATSNFDIQDAMISGSKTKFSLTSSSGVQSDSKEILEVKYIVNENLVTGDASPLSLKDVTLYDVNLREIFVRSITNGAFIVNNTNESENYIYVDSRNINLGNGSRQNPFNTIMKGIDAAGAGDTIIVFAGNYYGSVFMKEGITLLGSGASVTNIIASGDSIALIFSNIKNAEVSGFTIKGDQDHFPGTPIISCESSSPVIKKSRIEVAALPGELGITLWNNSNAILEQNYIKGVNIDVSGSNPVIKDNVIEASAGVIVAISCHDGSAPEINNNILDEISGGQAIYIYDANPTIKNNVIYCDDGGVGLFINNANNSKIYNNIFVDRSATGSGIQILNSSENEIINNTVITHGKGIKEQNSNSTIFNNIVINNNNFGVQLSPYSNSNYNDVWNNFSNYSGMDPAQTMFH